MSPDQDRAPGSRAPRPSAPTPDLVPPPCDVLCVGLACVDLLLSVPRHPAADEKLRADSRLVAPGGPAAVAAAQVARLGGLAAFAGLIGDETQDPFAALLRRAFAAEGIDHSALLSLAGHETPLAAILVTPDATRAVVSHRPAPPIPSQSIIDKYPPSTPALPRLPSARVILADGHRPEWNDALLDHARATRAPLVLDAGSWSDSVRALARSAEHVVASEACARAALDGGDPSAAPGARLRAALQARGDAVVAVTLGERGALFLGPGEDTPRRQGAFRITPTDTTGAGDAFHGAYALGLARSMDLPGLVRFASAAGALACTRAGAWPSLPSAAELDAFLALPSRPIRV